MEERYPYFSGQYSLDTKAVVLRSPKILTLIVTSGSQESGLAVCRVRKIATDLYVIGEMGLAQILQQVR